MIVRECEDSFVMIAQDQHARISGAFAAHWRGDLFYGSAQRASVERAIAEHDRAWIPADRQPFWNDRAAAPYSFVDFPEELKLVFYQRGIDEVEAMHPYAGLLCSRHYTRFAENDGSTEGRAFARAEEDRRRRLMHDFPDMDRDTLQFHCDLLRFCDNLSLYVCLNEPGASEESEHPWYRGGVPVPETFRFFKGERLHIRWKDIQTIDVPEFPFTQPFTIELNQKTIGKRAAAEQGLSASYERAPWTTVSVTIRDG